jgi:hypothetical protein
MAGMILCMGKGVPMTPVEQMKVRRGLMPASLAAEVIIPRASFMPRLPVQALALPLLTTMACPFPDRTFCMQSLTGAALTVLVVNVPAIADSTSETMSARSFLPGFFIAASATEKKNPFGILIEVSFFMEIEYMHPVFVFNCDINADFLRIRRMVQ